MTGFDPVGISDAAKRLGVEANTVSQWRQRKYLEFPEPEAWVSNLPVWNWPTIEAWAIIRGKIAA